MKRFFFILFSCLSLWGCSGLSGDEQAFDKEKQEIIAAFGKRLFNSDVINSKEILDTLEILSTEIFPDTAQYYRTPKAMVYANNPARAYFQVFEDPKGTITAIIFYKNGKKINAAEYYKNGQVMCRFSVKDDGVRDGSYFCYHENGEYRHTGYFHEGKEVKDSLKRYGDK